MASPADTTIGLIAGSGRLPHLFASAAKERGLTVHAVAHRGETDESLAKAVASLTWIRVGQLKAIVDALKAHGVSQAVMAGGIGRVKAISQARPDRGTLEMLAGVRSLRDDELLRATARYLDKQGIHLESVTRFVPQLLASEGLLAGPALSSEQERDVALGVQVAGALGVADVGQTVVVKGGVVLAVEAVEGTDACIRRAGSFDGSGAVVVKRVKPNQDERFDLPAIGPVTLEVMREAGAKVLAVDAGHSLMLDSDVIFRHASKLGISVVGVKMG
ncbi:MAG: UDP-2,3-diacylglucosamine diphosphatase LpxI [Myxococcaceae bacterium]